ncbi:hypothetical protein KC19_VG023900 [Ceratodon purpureus]|uniref:Secreted protein n=1 Tax=Ceratodon purpureus TaxID=3225 RepID=A0A8T0HL99_CERPU|nr:hypothetical protein KC19_VG023900 [Ceratodon purpureus]
MPDCRAEVSVLCFFVSWFLVSGVDGDGSDVVRVGTGCWWVTPCGGPRARLVEGI